jgi:hypothetical protein
MEFPTMLDLLCIAGVLALAVLVTLVGRGVGKL